MKTSPSLTSSSSTCGLTVPCDVGFLCDGIIGSGIGGGVSIGPGEGGVGEGGCVDLDLDRGYCSPLSQSLSHKRCVDDCECLGRYRFDYVAEGGGYDYDNDYDYDGDYISVGRAFEAFYLTCKWGGIYHHLYEYCGRNGECLAYGYSNSRLTGYYPLEVRGAGNEDYTEDPCDVGICRRAVEYAGLCDGDDGHYLRIANPYDEVGCTAMCYRYK